MAIARVSAHDGVGTTSATFGGTPTPGNLVLCAVMNGSQNISISLTGWTRIAFTGQTGIYGSLALFALTWPSSSPPSTSPAPSGGLIEVTSVCEYSGVSNPYSTDGTASGQVSSSSLTSYATPSITTINANDLIFTVGGANGSSAGPTGMSWTTATSILYKQNSYFGTFCGENIVSSTQSGFSDTAHWTNASEAAGTIIAAFEAAAAAPSYFPSTLMSLGVG